MNRARNALLLTCLAALGCQKTPEQRTPAASAPLVLPPMEAQATAPEAAARAAPEAGSMRPSPSTPDTAAPTAFVSDADAADVIYAHGVVLPMTGPDDVAGALAVRGGRIVAVGSDQSVLGARRGKATRVVDLAGRTVMPGFIDAHGSLVRAAKSWQMVQLAPPPLGGIRSIPQLVDAMRIGAPESAFGQWVVGTGYDSALLAERRHPTREELDAVSADRPVLALDVSQRVAVCNSACLRLLGYGPSTKDPAGGTVRRAPRTKEPTGVIEEAALDKALAAVPELSLDAALVALETAQERYVARGLTTVRASGAGPFDMKLLKAAASRGKLRIDVVASPLAEHLDTVASDYVSVPVDVYQSHLRRSGVTLALDGTPQSSKMWLSKPYATPPDGQKDTYRGAGRLDGASLRSVLERAKSERLQVLARCDGDEAAEQFLRACEGVLGDDAGDRRWLVLGAQAVREDQLARMKRLSISPSFAASLVYYWGDAQREASLGPERGENISPTHWAVEQKLRFSIHDDSPSVPPQPLWLLWAATNRITQDQRLLGPEQRLTTYEGLAALTIDAAYQTFEDKDKGSLEPGKRADLVILAQNPLSEPLSSLRSMDVVEVVKDGLTVWEP